jgi:hypothetical protein
MIAAAHPRDRLPSHVMSVAKFERFFRIAAGIDVDKQDLKRYSDFVNRKLYDLLVRGEETASANGRDIILPFDLPVTRGLHQSLQEFGRVDERIELAPILAHIASRPPLDLRLDDETEAMLPAIAGAFSVALARTFKIIDPALKNPQTEHWERAFRIFDFLQ